MDFQCGDERYAVWDFEEQDPKHLHFFTDDLVLDDGLRSWEFNDYLPHDKYICERAREDDRRPIPKGEDLPLLLRRIAGYALWERKFFMLDVMYLHPVVFNDKDNPFDKLQIPPIQKVMIQSIVASHFVQNDLENKGIALGTQDIIRGKGKGKVILLHGVPGVGKTATRKPSRKKWGKPLFPITCGDLGFTAASVEKSLNGIFRLEHLWDCVLLLDEADVFITQRTKSDLQRNALVSVFLRLMEYYNGILFLTINRPGVIDEAVKSRIHLSLRYESLSLDQTIAISERNIIQLRNIEEKRAAALKVKVMDIFEEDILSFVHELWHEHTDELGRWNGRQIRNAFLTAAALAHCEVQNKPEQPVQLRAEHFRKVQAASLVYEKYRASILNKTDSELAKQYEARNDNFDERTFSLRGPQDRARRAPEPFAKYTQSGIITPITPNRGHEPYAQGFQAQNSSVPGTFSQQIPQSSASGYGQHAGGYSLSQTGSYRPTQQRDYIPPAADPHTQVQQEYPQR